jgi:hypothetical protein
MGIRSKQILRELCGLAAARLADEYDHSFPGDDASADERADILRKCGPFAYVEEHVAHGVDG